MSIFREFNISMIPGKPPLIIHVSQYESDFVYTFHLVSGKSILAIPDTAIAVIRGTKRDGNGYSVEAALDAENHKVVVMGDPQLTACAGKNVFELAIINDEKVICTANFYLDVERAPLDSDTIQSETVLHDLQAIINSAATATQAAEEASASAESAASAAEQAVEEKFEDGVAETIDEWLTDHPEATTTVQDGAITTRKLADDVKTFNTRHLTPASEGAVTEIGETALTYINHSSDFVYGGHYTAIRDTIQQVDGKWEINCSTFALLLMFGVTYENSAYQRGVALGNVKSQYLCSDKGLWDFFASLNEGASGDDRFKYAYDMAEWMYNRGYCFLPNSDLSNIKPGDVLFMKDQTGSEMQGQFMGIDHVCVFAYWNSDRAYTVWEVGQLPSEQLYLIGNLQENCIFVGRLPYSSKETEYVDISDFSGSITSDQNLIKYIRAVNGYDYRRYYTFVGRIYYPEGVYEHYPVIYAQNTRLTAYENGTRKPNNSIFVLPFSPKQNISAVNLRINNRQTGDVQPTAILEWYCIVEGIHFNNKQLRHFAYLQANLESLADDMSASELDISDILSSTHSILTNSTHIEKAGSVIAITLGITLASDVSAFGVIATIAQGYRPIGQVYGYCATGPFDVTPTGNIRALSNITSGRTVQCTIVYIMAQ